MCSNQGQPSVLTCHRTQQPCSLEEARAAYIQKSDVEDIQMTPVCMNPRCCFKRHSQKNHIYIDTALYSLFISKRTIKTTDVPLCQGQLHFWSVHTAEGPTHRGQKHPNTASSRERQETSKEKKEKKGNDSRHKVGVFLAEAASVPSAGWSSAESQVCCMMKKSQHEVDSTTYRFFCPTSLLRWPC